MKKTILFISKLHEQIQKDDLMSIANDLTYKMFFALFPFIIFIMSIIGFLELDTMRVIEKLSLALPQSLLQPMEPIVKEIVGTKHPSLLSFSLIIALFGVSSGFHNAAKGINKAYGQKDTRKIIVKILTSVILALAFTCVVILSFTMLVFRDSILKLSDQYFGPVLIVRYLFGLFGYVATVAIIFFFIVFINKLAISQRITYRSLAPGSFLTIALWIMISKLFNMYINNFTRYSALYGSIAGIMILMIWLNSICIVLLLGSEVNAMCSQSCRK